jgi:hypothetical protein
VAWRNESPRGWTRFGKLRRRGGQSLSLRGLAAKASSDVACFSRSRPSPADFSGGFAPVRWRSAASRIASADDQVLNAVLVERGQEFFEVLTEHRALARSVDTPSSRVRRWHPDAHGPGGFANSGIRPL